VNRSLAPLRHRPFAILWTGAFVSNIGTWMETVGVGILVTETTGKSGWTGLVAAAAFAPSALLSPVGGALADRVPRRLLLLFTFTIQTLLAGTLAFLAGVGTPSPGVVTLIVLGAGCVQALGFPAYQALLPDLVPEEDLVGAVALSSAQWNLGRVIGPALAGLVIGFGGYQWAFAVNTASFAAVIVALLLVRVPALPARAPESIVRAIRAGLAYTRADPGLRVVAAYMALNAFFVAPFIALVPAMAINVFDAGSDGTALLTTAQGVGAVAMALSLGILVARFGNRRVLLGVLWGLPPALVLYAVMPVLALSAVAILAVGFLYLGALSSFTSIAQLRAPSAVRGRVLSLLMMILGSLYPLGSVLQGAVADEIGLRATTAGAAVLMLGALALARILRPRFADAVDRPVVPFASSPAPPPPSAGSPSSPAPPPPSAGSPSSPAPPPPSAGSPSPAPPPPSAGSPSPAPPPPSAGSPSPAPGAVDTP
jgi:MFS family permease